jgi:uncharacterized protein DUF4169
MGADIVNLRRVKKAKARAEKSTEADANRVKHGVAKSAHKLAQARGEIEARNLDARRLTDKEK